MISPAPSSRLQRRLFVRAIAQRDHRRRGLSVVELLAATVISLIVMGATVQLFGTVGAQISNGRSNIELSDRVRSAVERLRRDLRRRHRRHANLESPGRRQRIFRNDQGLANILGQERLATDQQQHHRPRSDAIRLHDSAVF